MSKIRFYVALTVVSSFLWVSIAYYGYIIRNPVLFFAPIMAMAAFKSLYAYMALTIPEGGA